ncbi:MAG TPA: acyl carrier protein [Methylomirabilota bacterium]|nr:acyl carrier protein [Methylomirabilota bacterium]
METRIRKVFSRVLRVDEASITLDSSPETITKWDSLGHMTLCLALEEEFGIEFDNDHVVEMRSFGAILQTVGSLAGR